MSMVLTTHSGSNRLFYAALFGRLVSKRRRELNLTVAAAAELTGITISEWMALEIGYVPESKLVRTIAATLEVRASDLMMASILSRLSQEQSVQ